MKGFLRSMLSEADGTVSCTRCCMAAVFFFALCVGTAFAFRVLKPLTIAEFGTFLGALGTFVATVIGPLYLINKGAVVLKRPGAAPDCDDKKEGE